MAAGKQQRKEVFCMRFEIYNLLNGKRNVCYSLSELFKTYVNKEREILVTDERGKKFHFKDGVKIGESK